MSPRLPGGTRRGFATLALFAALLPAAAAAAPPPPSALRILDGEGWQADARFSVGWTIPPSDPPAVAVHYRVKDPEGAVESVPVRLGWPTDHTDVTVDGPGAHTFEVWLEDGSGAQGPPADVRLRFDSARPGGVAPIPPGEWVGRNEFPYPLRLTHPADRPPVSGIRGYAVSIDRLPSAAPCASSYLCSEAETDLRGGLGDDTLMIPMLPEGSSYAHTLAVSGSQVRSAAPGHALIRVDTTDPVTRLSGVPGGWTNRAVTLAAVATDALSGMRGGPGAPITAIRVGDAPPVVSPGGVATTTVVAPGVHTISYYARDSAGNVNDGADSNGIENEPPSTATVRIDREPPAVVFAGSSDPADPELIEARVSDRLSGPDPALGEIAVRPAGSNEPFVPLPTAGAGEILLARWRSEDQPAGRYEFRVTGYDLAGNAAAGTRRANGEPMVLPNPLKARSTLTAAVGPRRAYEGRLTLSSDATAAGRSVVVVERFDPGAAIPRRTTSVDTDEEGHFSLRLDPGPSREVFAVFAGTSTAAGTTSRPLRLDVRPAVGLRASVRVARIGGRPVVFRGTVGASAGEIPPGGARVELQFRAAGVPWTGFRTVQTNARGRFRLAYRFSDDDSRGIRFDFRAFVPSQRDWPYERGGSRPVPVRGR
jgi:hypothetical protein